jgi:agmatinase
MSKFFLDPYPVLGLFGTLMENLPSTIAHRFCGLSRDESCSEKARCVIVPLPYDGTTSYQTGTRHGPSAIIEASIALERFDEELLYNPCQVGIATCEAMEPDARGPEQMVEAIQGYISPWVASEKFVVSLGGEHTVSIGCVRAFADHQSSPFSVLIIDAHADLRESYQNSEYSHACVTRRILESCPVVQVGLRSLSEEEYNFIQKEGLSFFSMSRIRANKNWIQQVLSSLEDNVYLSIDLDGLDPSICPGVGTPEPGGLTWAQTMDLLSALFMQRHVIGADVVECLPLPGQFHSEYLAARLVYKLLAFRYRAFVELSDLS